ncbi:MAG: DUF5076 domain-containing protein [Pseudomonadota bacterium]
MKELDVPPEVMLDNDAIEFVRFWVANNEDHVSLFIGAFDPPEDEPRMWGYIMADVAKHAVRGMMQDDPGRGTPEELMAQIEAGFFERLKQNPDLSGMLKGAN